MRQVNRKRLRIKDERGTIATLSRGGNMFHDLLYPNGLLYILIKLTVLALAVLLWFMVVSARLFEKTLLL
ncbi:MAG UNVERIFIED_CONTAM: hypothetical protein LVR29_28055 [Microcystis novacekii LVE1205-3]